jgi:Nif-specific regulatory protein
MSEPATTIGHGFWPTEAVPFIDEVELASAARSAACVLFSGPVYVRPLARRIHSLSGCRRGPFQAVDCGAPDSVLERELFSVLAADLVPPSVTGPSPRRAEGGTLFLHEIGQLRAHAQARLRDLLAERGRERLRGPQRRIMASTSDLLLPRVAVGTFDERLFYRLNVIHLIFTGNRQ